MLIGLMSALSELLFGMSPHSRRDEALAHGLVGPDGTGNSARPVDHKRHRLPYPWPCGSPWESAPLGNFENKIAYRGILLKIRGGHRFQTANQDVFEYSFGIMRKNAPLWRLSFCIIPA